MKEHRKTHSRNQSGFSLIELLVYLAILGILMSAVVISFTTTMKQTAQQSNIAETQIETGVGLEFLRADLENAGFGLYWQQSGVPNPYIEPLDSSFNSGADTLLTPLADVPNIPKAFSSTDALGVAPFISLNDSDYLVIRATNVIRGVTGQKWGYVGRDAAHLPAVQSLSSDTFASTDGVIVILPEIGPGQYRQLVLDTVNPNYITNPTSAAMTSFAPSATPSDPDGVKHLVYGLNVSTSVRRPFNRTDYYISDANVPNHCAPNTGVLVKATVLQSADTFDIMPIIDCVADFQVVYHLDNGAGVQTSANANGLNGLTAEQIRDQVKSVQCYILIHEGGIDRSYIYPNASINVGEVAADGVTLVAGRSFPLSTTILGGNWANYRWKVVSMAVTPKNLK